MLSVKRVIIATACGFLFGLVCLGLATSNPEGTESLSLAIQLSIVIGRTMLGFMIGISALRLNWWLHGLVLGFISSIPMATPLLDQPSIFVGTLVMGVIYGFLTEWITSKLFKSPSPFA